MVHIPKGKLGNLRADQLNELIDAAQRNPDISEAQTPPGMPGPPVASGRFPIVAKLGKLITPVKDDGKGQNEGYTGGDSDEDGPEDDTDLFGYKWEEISYNKQSNMWGGSGGERAYGSEDKNAAYGIGLQGTDPSKYPNFAGKGVLLFPGNDRRGKPILVFQVPPANKTTFPAQLTGSFYEGESCGAIDDGVKHYTFTPLKIDGLNTDGEPQFIVDAEVPDGIAFNIADFNGGSYGGSITVPEGSCGPETEVAAVSSGKRVMMHFLGWVERAPVDEGLQRPAQSGDTDENEFEAVYGFFVKNDLCVTCCDQEEGIKAGRDESRQRRLRENKNIASEMRL
tara:strand:- start:4146 stop:5162 length:1017 start_codon:yes stop_codon:yes gene_type:complete